MDFVFLGLLGWAVLMNWGATNFLRGSLGSVWSCVQWVWSVERFSPHTRASKYLKNGSNTQEEKDENFTQSG